jgi:hypothetical protein
VNRHWGQVGVRVASVGLLVLGLVGGVYLGRGRDARVQSDAMQFSVVADASEMQLLKSRENEHAAASAFQNEAESDAAGQAAVAAKAAASKAEALDKKMIQKKAAAKAAAKAKAAAPGALVPYTGPIPTSCKGYSGNRATGCALMLSAGFGIEQFPCLDKLWTKESGWNAHAENPSGAYGIPQAYPGDKMSSVGSDWKDSAATQIKWGLGYIDGRYSNPCGAWSQSVNTGSY